MSGDTYDISVRRDYSGVCIEEGRCPDTLEKTTGSIFDKTEWYNLDFDIDEDEQLMLWYGDFTMTEFVNLLMEYSDLGYYQLKNRCKAIVKGSQMTLDIDFGFSTNTYGNSIRWGGSVKIEDPVLAQAILDTYN
jgi:hypothetical protein